MRDDSYLVWPFLEARHREIAKGVDDFARAELSGEEGAGDDPRQLDVICRGLVRKLGAAGLLRHTVPSAYGGASTQLDVRTLCLVRERLAFHGALPDLSFVMQGLGSGASTKGAVPAASRTGRRDRRIGNVRRELGIRRRCDQYHRPARRRTLCD